LNTFNDVWDISFRDIADSVGDFRFKGSSVLEALLDQREIILFEESEHKSGNEVFNSGNIHLVVGGKNSCKGGGWSHFFSKLIN
tara:strand:+ start:392 stop:643 length:252 start_codon:yes stop_codon:yes gene_type:complete